MSKISPETLYNCSPVYTRGWKFRLISQILVMVEHAQVTVYVTVDVKTTQMTYRETKTISSMAGSPLEWLVGGWVVSHFSRAAMFSRWAVSPTSSIQIRRTVGSFTYPLVNHSRYPTIYPTTFVLTGIQMWSLWRVYLLHIGRWRKREREKSTKIFLRDIQTSRQGFERSTISTTWVYTSIPQRMTFRSPLSSPL